MKGSSVVKHNNKCKGKEQRKARKRKWERESDLGWVSLSFAPDLLIKKAARNFQTNYRRSEAKVVYCGIVFVTLLEVHVDWYSCSGNFCHSTRRFVSQVVVFMDWVSACLLFSSGMRRMAYLPWVTACNVCLVEYLSSVYLRRCAPLVVRN